jgi:FKBP-type peptidyl-prolyl cis-trans isomerase 2
MISAQPGDTVKIDFVGMLDDGTVFAKTVDKYPLQFTIGGNEVILGLEKAVIGMSPAETKTTRIPPEEAFGPARKEMNIIVDRGGRLQEKSMRTGDAVAIRLESGDSLVATLVSVSESTLILDPNHPLAGKYLTFTIRMLEIKQKRHTGAYLNRMAKTGKTGQHSSAGRWRESRCLPA